ncbi:MAG: DUF4402 domain-containing protein [Pseudomonadota bacterium]
MSQNHRIAVLGGIALLISSLPVWAAKPPPNEARCKSNWTLTSTQSLAFGAFYIESGSGTLDIDSSGLLTATGTVFPASSDPVTTFTVTVNNTLDPITCSSYGFDLSWSVAPAPLTNGAASMPLTNVLVSEPTFIPTPTALPILALKPTSLPLTLTFQGDLAATFPQAAGLYTSPAFTLDLTQSGTATSVSSTATATSLINITIAETVPMDFGTVAGGSSAGTVILDTAGVRSVTGSGQIFAAGPGSAASFQITGNPSQSYIVSFGGLAVLESATAQQITATTFTYNASGVMPVGGTDTFEVGATLNLVPLQPAGNYSTATGGGTPYTVTVNYN